MSQFRFARIGLLLAAIGLSAAPALVPAAYAQDKKEAAAAPQETVRKEMFKFVDPAVINPLLDAKKYDDVKALLAQADALADKTPFENFIITQNRLTLALKSDNKPDLVKYLGMMIDSGRLKPEDIAKFQGAIASMYLHDLKDVPKAIVAYKRYYELTGKPEVLSQVRKLRMDQGEYPAVKAEMLAEIDAAIKANKPVSREDLHLLGGSAHKLKDKDTYLVVLESLVRWYPNDQYWVDLMSKVRSKETYSNRFYIDVLRLQKAALTKMEGDDYLDMAELALLEGQFVEAKQALDEGAAKGVKMANDRLKKMKPDADRKAAEDIKNIATEEAKAKKAKTGTGLVNLGYAHVTMGQFDKGIELIKEGIAKGGMKNAEDAKLRLGFSYALAGKKEDAISVLSTVTGADGRADLARYWILWVNRPYEAKPAPAND